MRTLSIVERPQFNAIEQEPIKHQTQIRNINKPDFASNSSFLYIHATKYF